MEYSKKEIDWFNSQVPHVPTNRQAARRMLDSAIAQRDSYPSLEHTYRQHIQAERMMTAYWREKYQNMEYRPPAVAVAIFTFVIFTIIYAVIGFAIWRFYR